MIKFLKSYLLPVSLFVGYLAIEYSINGRVTLLSYWWVSFIAIGWSFLSLLGLYYNRWTRSKRNGLIALKRPALEVSDFLDVILYTGFVAFVDWQKLAYFLPAAAVYAYLIFRTQQHQYYYIAEYGIEDLNSHSDYYDVDTGNTLSYTLNSEKLEISYLINPHKDKNAKNNLGHFEIQKSELLSPRSWYEFEKMFAVFRESLEKEKAKSEKNATLDSTYESVS